MLNVVRRTCSDIRVFVVLLALVPRLAAAQTVAPAFSGSVPAGPVTSEPLPLPLSSALERGLRYNLGLMALEEQVESARGARIRMLRELMPHFDARADDATQTRNLAAFGFNASAFPGFPIPSTVGPFNIFDARVSASQTLLDVGARNDVRSTTFALNAARLDAHSARDLVTFVVTDLYLRTIAGALRIDTARGQVSTAEALLTLAIKQRNAGVTAGIDVVRAQVQLQTQRQRLIAAQNGFAKVTLQLARAIGIPAAQRLDLTGRDVVVPLPVVSLDDAIARARSRTDYRAALERVSAAEAALKSVEADVLPTIHLNADLGAIGTTPANARRTYAVGGSVRLSLFDSGRKGREVESVARLRQRQAEAADMAQRIESEVRGAFLDVQAAEQQLAVARDRVALAGQELSLAQTRFAAGVSSNLEVIQAQSGVSAASDTEIEADYAFGLAKAALVRALGTLPVEQP